MATQIFVNFPVKDLNKSIDFFTKVGYTFNQQFTDETGTCMVISDTIYAMLLTEEKFKTFTTKQIADTTKTTEVLLALSVENKEAVDKLVDKAMAAGATQAMPPADHGFMYTRSFNDPDGHTWEIFHMNPDFVQPG